MTETEEMIKQLECLMRRIIESDPETDSLTDNYAFIYYAYSWGYPVHIIAYVAGISEQTVYKRLRELPLEYEQAKTARKEAIKKNKQKSSGKPPEQNEEK